MLILSEFCAKASNATVWQKCEQLHTRDTFYFLLEFALNDNKMNYVSFCCGFSFRTNTLHFYCCSLVADGDL